MLALFTDLHFTELLVIAALSVMVFGRDLPRVLAKGVVQFQRLRRAMQQVWRESGISEEVRKVQREMENAAREVRDATPESPVEAARDELKRVVEAEPAAPAASAGERESAEAEGGPPEPIEEEQEPAGEASRRAAWYPRPEDDPFGRDPD